MSTLSRNLPFKLGEKARNRQTGQIVTVYDLDERNKIVYANWVEGPRHEMQKQAFNLQGPMDFWPIMKVATSRK